MPGAQSHQEHYLAGPVGQATRARIDTERKEEKAARDRANDKAQRRGAALALMPEQLGAGSPEACSPHRRGFGSLADLFLSAAACLSFGDCD